MRENNKCVSPASVKVKANVTAKQVYPIHVASAGFILTKKHAKELARNLLIVAFGDNVSYLQITGFRDGHITVLGRPGRNPKQRK